MLLRRLNRLGRPILVGFVRPAAPAFKPHCLTVGLYSTQGSSYDATPAQDTTAQQADREPEAQQPETPDSQGSDKKPEEKKDAKEMPYDVLLLSFNDLQTRQAQTDEEVKQLKNKLAYALADIDNVRKISRKDVANAREFSLKDFGKDLLDVVDNCERALSIFPEECKVKGHPLAGIYVGLEMTANAMLKAFSKHGLERISVEPQKTLFDPNLHEALFQQPVPGLPAGVIFALVKSGWTLNGRVLRAAQVGVSADPPEGEAPATPEEPKAS